MENPNLQRTAHITGTFWLLTIIAGFATLAGGSFATTANTIGSLTYIGASIFGARLLSLVNRNMAVLSGLLGTLGCLITLEHAFLHSLNLPRNLPFLFFGSQLLILGFLIMKSTYIPNWVGYLLCFGGLGWLTLGLSSLLAPEFARSLLPFILLPGIVAETALTLRLLIKGVNQ